MHISYITSGIPISMEFKTLRDAIDHFEYDLEKAFDGGIIDTDPAEIKTIEDLQELVTEYYSS